MPDHRTGRQEKRRAFRPTLDGKLETRVLMATSAIHAQTAAGGQAVVVTNTSGARFYVSVTNGGTVRATPASGGRVNLVVDGTNSGSLVEINRVVPGNQRGMAHTFQPGVGNSMPRLNLASVRITSGMVSAIEGYQTAELSGPITVAGSVRVDRIALSSILAGGSISVSGDLNTLDIYRNVNLSGGSISVGRDLNWFQTFGNVSITNNSNIIVGRYLGLTAQPAKGSGNAGQGMYVGGNLTIDSTSSFAIGQYLAGTMSGGAGILINGNFSGISRFFILGFPAYPPSPASNLFGGINVLGTLAA